MDPIIERNIARWQTEQKVREAKRLEEWQHVKAELLKTLKREPKPFEVKAYILQERKATARVKKGAPTIQDLVEHFKRLP